MLFQRLDWRVWNIHHLVVWMEPQEMDWIVRTQIVIEPPAQLPSMFQLISYFRDHQVCELHVDLGLVLDLQNSLEDRVSVRNPDVFPDKTCLSVPLEVNRNTVQEIIHHSYRVRSIVAVRDEDIDQAIPSRLNPDIVRKLHEYCRLIIRIRETLTAMTQGQCGNFGWHHIRTFHLPPLAYVKVLTVRAVM